MQRLPEPKRQSWVPEQPGLALQQPVLERRPRVEPVSKPGPDLVATTSPPERLKPSR